MSSEAMMAKLERQGKELFQWGEELVDITIPENLAYEAALQRGQETMCQCLEEAERILSRQRDKMVWHGGFCSSPSTINRNV